MAQGEERRGVGQHSTPPSWVTLVSNDQVLLVGGDGLEKNRRLFVLIWGREVILEEQVQHFVTKSNLTLRMRSKAVFIDNITPEASHLV